MSQRHTSTDIIMIIATIS